ncbi:GGDEF domain-containing protein [Enterococcus cecorum]|uniref:GGDEF domain-containing protein n=1 Tax=Enterococcus cecorum TaxID=44008 RepID=UPI0032C451BE
MFYSILANISVLTLAIYLYFRMNDYLDQKRAGPLKRNYFYCLWVVLVGTVLMNYSFVAFQIHFDFRFILIALACIYFDWSVVIASIFFLALTRFIFEPNQTSVINLFFNIYLMATLPIISKYSKKRLSIFHQMNVTMSFILISLTILHLMLGRSNPIIILNCLILLASGVVSNALMSLYIEDLSEVYQAINFDPLTKLLNRRKLNQLLMSLENSGEECCIGILDIDYFKKFNDTYGHAVGDQVLRFVADYLRQIESPNARIFRFGGEEMVIVLFGNNLSESCENLVQLQENLPAFCQQQVDFPYTVTLSQGIAHKQRNENLFKTLNRADQALYRAKEQGRNQTILSD